MGTRILNFGYVAMFFFGLAILFVIAELMFYLAGWMIFGSLGHFLAWLIYRTTQQDYDKSLVKAMAFCGRACGIFGVYYFW